MRNRRNTAILGALIIVLLIFSAFQWGRPSGGVTDPFQFARQSGAVSGQVQLINAPNGMFGCNHLCPPSGWFWGSTESAILVYPTSDQTSAPFPNSYMWDVVAESGGKWFDLGGGGGSLAPGSASNGSLLSYTSQPIPASSLSFRYGIRQGYILTVGQSLTPLVWSVELRYDTGQTIQQRLAVSKDGATAPFGVITKAKTLCSIRLFDQNGSLLQTLDASNDQMLAFEIDQYAPGTCGH